MSHAGNEGRVEVPLPPTPSEDDRAVPKGLRPGKPLPAQPVEAPMSNTKRLSAEGQISPEAAGKPLDARPAPESSTQPAPGAALPKDSSPKQPKSASSEEADKEAKKLLDEEEERRKQRRRKKGRIRELEEIRAELAEKELVLLGKEQELLEKDQTVAVLREEVCTSELFAFSIGKFSIKCELLKSLHPSMCVCLQLELEKKLRTLLTKEKEKAEEQSALALGKRLHEDVSPDLTCGWMVWVVLCINF